MSTKQIGGYTVFLSQVLGHGSFGNVYRGIKDDDKQLVAVKIIPKYLSTSAAIKSTPTNTSKLRSTTKSRSSSPSSRRTSSASATSWRVPRIITSFRSCAIRISRRSSGQESICRKGNAWRY